MVRDPEYGKEFGPKIEGEVLSKPRRFTSSYNKRCLRCAKINLKIEYKIGHCARV
jgi:hypothetical protein